MTLTDLILICVIVAITGTTIALLGIRKAIDGLAAELRKRETAEKENSE